MEPSEIRVLDIERPFLRVPLECLTSIFRSSQKQISKELNGLTSEMKLLLRNPPDDDPLALRAEINRLRFRVAELRSSSQETLELERRYIEQFSIRYQHLNETASDKMETNTPEFNGTKSATRKISTWAKQRLARLVAENLLRRGILKSAECLTREAGLENMIDTEVFETAREVVEALKNRDCTPALKWCATYSSRLKRLESRLEFDLRLQQFIELVRKGQRNDAMEHARKYLSPMAENNAQAIQVAMGALIFDNPLTCKVPEYAQLFSEDRWKLLTDKFMEENCHVHSLAPISELEIALQAGLSVLKTPMCSDEQQKSLLCPVCSEAGNKLAANLPFAHHGHSCLVCRMSGEVMDENNPPMVLPNGSIYSQKALKAMAESNDDIITCLRTGEEFDFQDAKQVYII